MDFHLDALLNLPNITIERYTSQFYFNDIRHRHYHRKPQALAKLFSDIIGDRQKPITWLAAGAPSELSRMLRYRGYEEA